MTMTPLQISLARHALGFRHPDTRKSYRNHFVAGPGHHDYDEWVGMVRHGLATQRKVKGFGGDDLFHLTRAGAEAALLPGERLDPDDFPK